MYMYSTSSGMNYCTTSTTSSNVVSCHCTGTGTSRSTLEHCNRAVTVLQSTSAGTGGGKYQGSCTRSGPPYPSDALPNNLIDQRIPDRHELRCKRKHYICVLCPHKQSLAWPQIGQEKLKNTDRPCQEIGVGRSWHRILAGIQIPGRILVSSPARILAG